MIDSEKSARCVSDFGQAETKTYIFTESSSQLIKTELTISGDSCNNLPQPS
jgi:hypothetical protein